MDNKFDAYEGFDPTKDKTSNIDCGEVYWDMVTQTWRKRPIVKLTNAELNAVIAKYEAKLNDANAELEKAKARIAELEKQLADQPTVCDVLKAHLDPVHRLNDETIYYAVKDADCDFIKGDVTSLGEETVHPLAEG